MTKYEKIIGFNIDEMAGFVAETVINAMNDPIEATFDELKQAFFKALHDESEK